jgi:hypothetical protein
MPLPEIEPQLPSHFTDWDIFATRKIMIEKWRVDPAMI